MPLQHFRTHWGRWRPLPRRSPRKWSSAGAFPRPVCPVVRDGKFVAPTLLQLSAAKPLSALQAFQCRVLYGNLDHDMVGWGSSLLCARKPDFKPLEGSPHVGEVLLEAGSLPKSDAGGPLEVLRRLASVEWVRHAVLFGGSAADAPAHTAIIAHATQDPHGCGRDVCRHVAVTLAQAAVQAAADQASGAEV